MAHRDDVIVFTGGTALLESLTGTVRASARGERGVSGDTNGKGGGTGEEQQAEENPGGGGQDGMKGSVGQASAPEAKRGGGLAET